MPPLERFAALTELHWAALEAVRELEFTWGHGSRPRAIAERLDVVERVAETLLTDLAAVRLVVWDRGRGMAFGTSGLPVLGEVA